jgi:LysR family transcriptional regulator for bpeEF and oprC
VRPCPRCSAFLAAARPAATTPVEVLPTMDKLAAIEAFVRVAECGSFSRAAASLGLANASVTTAVRSLEREMHVILINRDTRRLRLTEEGEIYLRHAREVLTAVKRSEEETRLLGGQLRGRVNVEATFSIAHDLLSPALPEFARRHPDVTIALTLSNHTHNMIERAIDVAIRVGVVEDADLVARPLFESNQVMCASPEVAATLPPHPRDLDPRRCIGFLPEARHAPERWLLRRGEEAVDVLPDGPLHFNTAVDAVEAAEAGAGVACVMDTHARSFIERRRVVQCYKDWKAQAKTVYVVIPKSRVGSAKVRAFTDFVSELAAGERRPSGHRLVGVKPSGR